MELHEHEIRTKIARLRRRLCTCMCSLSALHENVRLLSGVLNMRLDIFAIKKRLCVLEDSDEHDLKCLQKKVRLQKHLYRSVKQDTLTTSGTLLRFDMR